jgi:hypothetical protein
MTRRAKQGYIIVFTPLNGCNGFCCTPGSNSVVYVIARLVRDTIKAWVPAFAGTTLWFNMTLQFKMLL